MINNVVECSFGNVLVFLILEEGIRNRFNVVNLDILVCN